jgi:formamidopyrimidine-DNA glycosylase
MPEMAEVETVRNVLKKKILNKKIVDIKIIYSKMIDKTSLDLNNLIDQKFIDIKRKGKYLIFETKDYYLVSHLRMEGKYFIKDKNDEIIKHEHIIISFDDNTTLRYHDVRKFGIMCLLHKNDLNTYKELNKLGYEVGDNNLTSEYLLNKLKNKRLPIKSLLLDQSIIAGLGNIYADEVLFRAGIDPNRLGSSITLKECEKIKIVSKEIIEKAIECGGTTIRSYTSSLGVIGHYQDNLMVHKREGEPCKVCNTTIKRIKIGGRSTYYCNKCQK